jgi:4-hydroxy-2-oxoheptanedioate aldolase
MRANKIKQMWREGKCVTMGWLSVSNGFTAEVMARQGFDALVIDMQQGLTEVGGLYRCCRRSSPDWARQGARVANDPATIRSRSTRGVRHPGALINTA